MAKFKLSRLTIKNLFIYTFLATCLSFSTGLGGCDQAPSTADNASTEQGDSVDVGGDDSSTEPGGGVDPSENQAPVPSSSSVKNVILVVGSGMGPQQVGQVVNYRRLRMADGEKLALERLMDKKYLGMVSTHSYLDIVSDTASANSAMACGHKARNNTVGMDANGNPCETILEKATALGKATGLVTNAKISHPGISAHGAHQLERQDQNEIASDLIEKQNIDVILAGGLKHLLPTSQKMSDLEECSGTDPILDGDGAREDDTNLVEAAKGKGYDFACTLDQLDATSGSKVLGLFANSIFPLSPDRKGLANLPSLAQMTDKALKVLSSNANGFLLVVHSGLTNVAAQDNDAGSLLQEGLDFDQAIKVALDFAEANPDTLLLFTSDHETGGFGFAYSKQPGANITLPSGEEYNAPYNYAPLLRLDLLSEQQKSFNALTSPLLTRLYGDSPDLDLDAASSLLITEVESHTPYSLTSSQAHEILKRVEGFDNTFTKDFKEFYVHDNIHSNLLGRAVAKQTSTVWASGTPTSTPVLLVAMGPDEYASRVRGFLDNTIIAKIINDAMLGK